MTTPTEELAKPFCSEWYENWNGSFYKFDSKEKLQAFREAVEAESDAESMKQPAVAHYLGMGKMQFTGDAFIKRGDPLYAQPFPSTEQLQQRVKKLADALRDIAKQDPVEMALDPQWAARVARITLTECGDVAS